MKKLLIPLLFALLLAGTSAFAATTGSTSPQANTATNASAANTQDATSSPTPSVSSDAAFIQLTSLPGLDLLNQNNAPDLAGFLNNLYRLCVGIAAALAVIQIIHAGVLWMSAGDSSEKVSQARHLIGASIFGLILVLSPVIVFSIVNPNVLNLNLNFSDLKSNFNPVPQQQAQNDLGQSNDCKNNEGGCTVAPTSKNGNGDVNTGCAPIGNGQIIDPNNSMQVGCCQGQWSDIAQCTVQARSRQVGSGFEQVSYCGCSIKENIVLDYYIYYAASKSDPSQVYKKVGMAPYFQTTYNKLSSECTAAGGKVNDVATRGGLFQSEYIDCPAEARVPADPTKLFRCVPMELSCKSQ